MIAAVTHQVLFALLPWGIFSVTGASAGPTPLRAFPHSFVTARGKL
jgi:hypothetical protein